MSRSRKKPVAMPLAELLETYIAQRLGLRPLSADSYRWTLRAFEKHLGRKATLADLSEETVNAYVAWKQSKWSSSAVVNRWGNARTTGPELSKWWTSLVLFLYDTGSRIGAALEVTPIDVDLDRGLVTLRGEAAKTGLEQVLRISSQTVAAIREIYDPKAKRVWMFCCHPRRLQYYLGRILDLAGLPNDRTRKFHCLRKTCATLTAAAGRLDLAQSTLGHTSGYMTRNYIDQRAAPSQSAADVLPRPVYGNGNGQAKHEAPPPPTEKPSGDALAMLAAMPPEQLQALVKLAKALAGG